MTRRLLLIASLPLAVAVTIGVLAMLHSRPGVTKVNHRLVQQTGERFLPRGVSHVNI